MITSVYLLIFAVIDIPLLKKSEVGLMVKLRNLRLSIIVHLDLKEMVYSVKKSLDLLKIMNVLVESTKEFVIKT